MKFYVIMCVFRQMKELKKKLIVNDDLGSDKSPHWSVGYGVTHLQFKH